MDVYFISDHTGLTVTSFGKTLLSQFSDLKCVFHTKPYVDGIDTANNLLKQIQSRHNAKDLVLLFSSIVDPNVRAVFSGKDWPHFDVFDTFLPRLESVLGKKPNLEKGRVHGMADHEQYMTRIAAVEYALIHDDGVNVKQYREADIILIGVSRSGKTPTSLYMAIQFGIKAANYPLTEDELSQEHLPDFLLDFKDKLFGLIIESERLQEIRSERLPNTRYASLSQCQQELTQVKHFLLQYNIPFINTSYLSIEEIATRVLSESQLSRRVK